MPSCRWEIACDSSPRLTKDLAIRLGLPQPLAFILRTRGLTNVEAARRFLAPRLRELSDPFLIPAMQSAVERILEAFAHDEKIVLYGDYDVDGISSLALLHNVFSAYNHPPACFLPFRMDEGYGLTSDGLARCVEAHRPHLLIAVDCGTNSVNEIDWLSLRGIDTIVLDHHEPKGDLPRCVALANPKLGEGFHYLCSAGLAFKLAHALLKACPIKAFDLRQRLDFVALGTLADLVPLLEENRILAKSGLARMQQTTSVGLRVLQEIASIEGSPSSADVGFRLGPRLNAAGRLGTAEQALHLLLTADWNEARRLALALDAQNRERQRIEQQTLLEAERQVEVSGQQEGVAIVVGALGWHPGVVGIVAARLCRKYSRPAIVVGFDENGQGKGSGRSIEGFSLVDALSRCSSHLQRHGGHAMAAGLALAHEQFEAFRSEFTEVAASTLDRDSLIPRLRIDAELTLAEAQNPAMPKAYASLSPFGAGHPQPVFILSDVTPQDEPRWLKDKHLTVTLRQGNLKQRAIYFAAPREDLPPPPWDVALKIETEEYCENGVALHIQGIRSSRTEGS